MYFVVGNDSYSYVRVVRARDADEAVGASNYWVSRPYETREEAERTRRRVLELDDSSGQAGERR